MNKHRFSLPSSLLRRCWYQKQRDPHFSDLIESSRQGAKLAKADLESFASLAPLREV